MIDVRIGDYSTSVVDNWTDTPSSRILHFHYLLSKGHSQTEIIRRIAFRWSGIPFRTYRKMNFFQTHDFWMAMEWVFSAQPPAVQKFPIIRHGVKSYFGCGNNLENVKVKEWMLADAAFNSYIKNRNIEDLNKAIAFLYRPVNKSGVIDKREPFDEERCLYRVGEIAKWKSYVKDAVLFNYLGMRNQLNIDFKPLFNGKSKGVSFGIPGMVHDLSGPEIGSMQEIENNWTVRNLLWVALKNEIRRKEVEK